jgi:cytochrome c peroxidase
LPKSITLDGKSTVQRNSPTLIYSTFQYSQFWDGSAKSLDKQILTVMENALEMGTDHNVALEKLRRNSNYATYFKILFPGNGDTSINMQTVSSSLQAFLQTLAPFNSSFDRYINGDRTALKPGQIRGFNLFMGKAQCGTCHFAPLFNGLVPPLYNKTELEVLGVTDDTNFTHPQLDADEGRFKTFPIAFYKGAFKTPTVRNVAKTGPYMHNGTFSTLDKILEFYNRGGGLGLGLHVPSQTLSPQRLHLKKSEIQDIIKFLNSLTDTYPSLQDVD